jgi:transcriptional regulator with XRE-family HTH domain
LAGCSTQAFAAAVGVSSASIGLIETGVRVDPRSSTVIGIAQACGIPFGWLLCGEGPEPDAAAVRAAVERARAARAEATATEPEAA